MGSKKDVDLAVNSAKKAFVTWSQVKKNEKITLLENLLKILNDFIVNNNNEKDFSQEEKELMKKVLNSIIELEKINKNKLGFFDSLNNYFYDSINK